MNVARVLLLSMTTTLVLGFSKPGPVPESPADSELSTDSAEPIVLGRALPTPQADLSVTVRAPVRRLASYADSSLMMPVLDQVSSRHWVKPSRYSPDRARADLQRVVPGYFHGVGFPNIRTHGRSQEPLGFSLEQPSHWSRMVTWRGTDQDVLPREPIAHVRCMGLSPQAVARRADQYDRLILANAVEYEVSASLIKAIITEESCFNAKAKSPVGALGLMQLMPDTARWLKVHDSLDPEQNLRAGVRYFASLQEQFDSLELALAAYNAGPGNVRRYNGVPPFAETRAYVQKVQAHYRRYVAATQLASR